jgi:multiple sugar transport system ATP-binding protein
VRTAIGDLKIAGALRRGLESGNGGGRRGVIVGIRPEHFEDATLVTAPETGHTLKAKIDVLEALGSDNYAHFSVDSDRVASSELEELLEDTDPAAVAPAAEGVQIVARLAAGSEVRQGQQAELWVDTSQLYLFDPDSGLSLLPSDLSRAGRSSAARHPWATGART